MFYLKKNLRVSAAHRLPNYDGPCGNLHGHEWNITVYCKTKRLDDKGMVIDFTNIKKICNQLDHDDINKYVQNPTAENIAEWIYEQIPQCYQVTVEETPGSEVTYTGEEDDERSCCK